MFHELPSRDRGEGCATVQPQGVGSGAYLNSTPQGPTPEDARKDFYIRGRSGRFMKNPGQVISDQDSPLPTPFLHPGLSTPSR